jgi:hypothetical protein
MAPPPHTMRLAVRADWALMIAIHDALRRDLDQGSGPSWRATRRPGPARRPG